MLTRIFVVVVCGLASIAQAAELKLSSPRDYQVFQRVSHSSGFIEVAGTAEGAKVDVRIGDGAWQTLEVNNGAFSAKLPTVPRGWYVVQVRGGEQVATVEHVGVGEVFVVAGQSNSTNYGEKPLKVASGLVSTFDGQTWRIADDPQPGVQDKSKSGSCWPAFGDAMVARLHVPIAVAVVGHGGTSVMQWQPKGAVLDIVPTGMGLMKPIDETHWECTGKLYDGLVTRIRQLGPHHFRAVLWHQGESDSNQKNPRPRRMNGSEYAKLLTTVIEGTQREAGWRFPWFVANATFQPEPVGVSAEIRAAQQSLWQSGVALEGPDTDTLTGDHRDKDGKGVHFSEKGQIAHGKLWAEKVAAWVEKQK